MIASKENFLSGEIILIDKPLEWTSFQVVNKIRWIIKSTYGVKKIKVGHESVVCLLCHPAPREQGLLRLQHKCSPNVKSKGEV